MLWTSTRVRVNQSQLKLVAPENGAGLGTRVTSPLNNEQGSSLASFPGSSLRTPIKFSSPRTQGEPGNEARLSLHKHKSVETHRPDYSLTVWIVMYVDSTCVWVKMGGST